MEEYDIFAMKHCHLCHPSLASSTVWDRVKTKLIPAKYEEGKDVEFTFPQLVHVGVDDEMAVLGARQNLKQVATPETHFFVLPQDRKQYEAQEPAEELNKPPYYYSFYSYACRVRIEVLHAKADLNIPRRHKRSKRVYKALYYPDPEYYPDAKGIEIPSIDCFSYAIINVEKIADHCRNKLGIGITTDDIRKIMASSITTT